MNIKKGACQFIDVLIAHLQCRTSFPNSDVRWSFKPLFIYLAPACRTLYGDAIFMQAFWELT